MTTEPDWTAQLDQLTASARDFAKLAAAYFRALVEEGIPVEAAVNLTNGYVQGLIVASGLFGQGENDA